MGSAASKSAGAAKRLPKTTKQTLKPSVKAERALPEETPQEPGIVERMRMLGPVKMKEVESVYKPSKTNQLRSTIDTRATLEQINETEFLKTTNKTLLPAQTIAAVVCAMRSGEPRKDIQRTYSLDPSVFDKLDNLRLPQVEAGSRR